MAGADAATGDIYEAGQTELHGLRCLGVAPFSLRPRYRALSFVAPNSRVELAEGTPVMTTCPLGALASQHGYQPIGLDDPRYGGYCPIGLSTRFYTGAGCGRCGTHDQAGGEHSWLGLAFQQVGLLA